MNDYHKLARSKFPYGRIVGDGRIAVVRKCRQGSTNRWRINLYKEFDHASRMVEEPCSGQCQGTHLHFLVILCPDPDMPKTAPVTKPVEPPPPLFRVLRP
jgi:hypothetical protein